MHYILEGKKAVPCDSEAWSAFRKEDRSKRLVAFNETSTHIVSTIFFGLDQQFYDGGPPLIFETGVLDKTAECELIDQDRYSTWEEAARGHKKMWAKYFNRSFHVVS